MWTAELVRRKASLERDKLAASATDELAADATIVEADANASTSSVEADMRHTNICNSCNEPFTIELEKLPPDYVAMRH